MDSDNLARRIPDGTPAGPARSIECRMDITGVPIAFVDVKVRDRAEFDGVFLFFIVADEEEFIAQREGAPFPERNGFKFKIHFGGINLIEPEIVCRIVIEDAGFCKAAVVEVNFNVSRAAAGDVPVCGDNPACCVYNEAGSVKRMVPFPSVSKTTSDDVSTLTTIGLKAAICSVQLCAALAFVVSRKSTRNRQNCEACVGFNYTSKNLFYQHWRG